MTDRISSIVGAHLSSRLLLSTVSGVASTKKEMIRWFDKDTCIDVITTKSFQVTANPGNREPVICEVAPGDFGNSVGLRNPGMDVALAELEELRANGLDSLLNVSVSASSIEDFVTLVRAFDHVADSIELNFSCPHAKAGFGASIGSDCSIASSYVRGLREAFPQQKSALLVKLTPNVDDIASIAIGCIEAGADGIVAINTVGPRLYTEKHSGQPILNNALGGKGGASGAWIKDVALDAVDENQRGACREALQAADVERGVCRRVCPGVLQRHEAEALSDDGVTDVARAAAVGGLRGDHRDGGGGLLARERSVGSHVNHLSGKLFSRRLLLYRVVLGCRRHACAGQQ